jgi:hypothetical protein
MGDSVEFPTASTTTCVYRAPLASGSSGGRSPQIARVQRLTTCSSLIRGFIRCAIPNFLKSSEKRCGAKMETAQREDAFGVNERFDLTETSGGWG